MSSRIESLRRQEILLSPQPSRAAIRNLAPVEVMETIRIFVYRNTPAEYVTALVDPFLSLIDIRPQFSFSDYDDSLSSSTPPPADLVIIWLDFTRYSSRNSDDFGRWMANRVAAIRSTTTAPILVIGSDVDELEREDFNQTLMDDLHPLGGVKVVDPGVTRQISDDLVATTQARWTGARSLELSRLLACRWIPDALHRHVRMIVLDLDNTLYQGVLGEDGLDGLVITDEHQKLLIELRRLASQGVLFAIASKNDQSDVEVLLDSGVLEPLTRSMLLAIKAGWNEKAESIAELLELSRLGASTVLFMDDNPGELASALMRIPGLRVAHATDPVSSCSVVDWFPGVWRSGSTAEDEGRTRDLKANIQRAELAASLDPYAYLRDLAVEVNIDFSPHGSVARIAELSNKTNQFNLAFGRFSEAAVLQRIDTRGHFLAAASLRDRFADGGLIAVLSGYAEEEKLIVDEISISCRALGRGLENLIIASVLSTARAKLGTTEVLLCFVPGPRNEPARMWLENNASEEDPLWRWLDRGIDPAVASSVKVEIVGLFSATHGADSDRA